MNRRHFLRFVGMIAFMMIGITGCATVTIPEGKRAVDATVAHRVLQKILHLQDLAKQTNVDEYGFYLPTKTPLSWTVPFFTAVSRRIE